MLGGPEADASSPEKIVKIWCVSVRFGAFRCVSVRFGAFRCVLVHFGAFWCIFSSDCVLKNSPKLTNLNKIYFCVKNSNYSTHLLCGT